MIETIPSQPGGPWQAGAGGPLITILAHFGGPWDHFGTILVIKWDTHAFKGTLEGPRMDFG